MHSSSQLPDYVTDLFAFYTPPKPEAGGLVTFYEKVEPGEDLEQVALRHYRYFFGGSLEPFWMIHWELAYQRPTENQGDFVNELYTTAANIYDDYYTDVLDIWLFDDPEEREMAQNILAAVYDTPEVIDFRIYACGDGEALQGVLTIGCRANGETTTLAFFID
ncbi:hypothetical protein [Geitlerinema sp. PCC 9228]|uniref:hypothetical protein n=1 Tax=Geitlerinema sp. PCC 9228 TaxID=111611 RepID=UPI000A004C9F|nr:hypothetical protein [Geitlerinema sp. PCC 9228]